MLLPDQGKYRKDYVRGELSKLNCPSDPMVLFSEWLSESIEFTGDEPAMVLSTVGHDNRPSSRVVLLKKLDQEGLHFFTNYNSRKGKELSTNKFAAVNFFWRELEKQIRVEGEVKKLSKRESDNYFNSRPEEARVNAIISPQSEEVPDRKYLLDLQVEYYKSLKLENRKLFRPEYWGGFLLIPDRFEFWQGRKGRLHDRILYTRQNTGWNISRLAP